jgi:hypothetical protein
MSGLMMGPCRHAPHSDAYYCPTCHPTGRADGDLPKEEPREPSAAWTDRGLTDSLIGMWGQIAVLAEDARQQLKWGLQTHSPAEWAVIIAEEEGELQKELCEAHFGRGNLKNLRAEAIQTATLALKIAKMAEEQERA